MIIGLTGYGGTGKTTVANILRWKHGFEGPHIKAPIKKMAVVLLEEFDIPADMIERYLDGDLKRDVIPELGISGTQLQQFIGFELGRECIRDDLWLDLWLRRVGKIVAAGGSVVQESVRAQNEVDAIRARGGLVAEVRRPGVGALPGGHKSEFLIPDPDVVISNDGTVADLELVVASLVAA